MKTNNSLLKNFGKSILRFFSPICYVKAEYKHVTKHKLNLKNPQRYTEKLQYLRLFEYPKNNLVSQCASKENVRDYVKQNKLDDFLIPIYGTYKKFEDIDFDHLPNSFVMKCSHGCGFNLIVKNKNELDLGCAKKMFNKWLKTNYGKKTVEHHYCNIEPKIIIEKYIGESPTEYKIHVFNGVAKSLYVVTNRGKDIRYTNFYIDWKPFDGSQFNGWKKADFEIKKPANWQQMVEIAEKLSKPFPFVRVDLYNVNGQLYFGEMTFTPAKGTLKLDDDKCDFEMGEWLTI